jgi:hypothetical protein
MGWVAGVGQYSSTVVSYLTTGSCRSLWRVLGTTGSGKRLFIPHGHPNADHIFTARSKKFGVRHGQVNTSAQHVSFLSSRPSSVCADIRNNGKKCVQ